MHSANTNGYHNTQYTPLFYRTNNNFTFYLWSHLIYLCYTSSSTCSENGVLPLLLILLVRSLYPLLSFLFPRFVLPVISLLKSLTFLWPYIVRPFRNCWQHTYRFHKYSPPIVPTRTDATQCVTFDSFRKISDNNKQQIFYWSTKFWQWLMTLTR